MDGDDAWRQEWLCSGWKLGAGEEQLGVVDWMGESWEQKGAEEDFAEGTEQQLLGEGHNNMRADQKRQSRLPRAEEDGDWGA